MLSLAGLGSALVVYYLLGLFFQLCLLFNVHYVAGWNSAAPNMTIHSAFVGVLLIAFVWPKHLYLLIKASF
jgi:hypothetical protein